jgi:hypothetical protein
MRSQVLKGDISWLWPESLMKKRDFLPKAFLLYSSKPDSFSRVNSRDKEGAVLLDSPADIISFADLV